MAASASASTAANPNHDCDVFISHRGPDVKKTLASHLYHRLLSHGLRVFLDVKELQCGDDLSSQIKGAIGSASVHVAIFSPHYAESKWCLGELVVMLQSDALIIPVYYHVRPAELGMTRSGHGQYGEALHRLEERTMLDRETGEMKPRYDSATIENWRNSLSRVADISGFDLDWCNGDEGELLEKVVERVLKKCERPPLKVFINHRGPDVKKTFASYLYHRLRSYKMEVFLDQEELKGGDNLNSRIENAIRSSAVHVAIFSPRYAESIWCLKELVFMIDSGAPIIPVFYQVEPSELRHTRLKSKLWWTTVKNGVYAEALHNLERNKGCCSEDIENYRNALSRVADISGFNLEKFKGDEGQLLENVVERLLELTKR